MPAASGHTVPGTVGLAFPTPAWLGLLAGCCAILFPLDHRSTPHSLRDLHPLPPPGSAMVQHPHPSASRGVLPAHRQVGLDEPVLQIAGLLPAPLTAQAVQLAQRGPQDVCKGTDPPTGTWGTPGHVGSWVSTLYPASNSWASLPLACLPLPSSQSPPVAPGQHPVSLGRQGQQHLPRA